MNSLACRIENWDLEYCDLKIAMNKRKDMESPKILIIGAGGFATQVIEAFELMKVPIQGLIDDNVIEPLLGHPILGTIKDWKRGVIPFDRLFCGIGDLKTRAELFQFSESLYVFWTNCIHPSANISRHAEIGTGNYFGPNCSVMPRAKIGNNNIVDPGAVISHDVKIGDHNHLAALSCLLGRVSIGDQNLFGGSSTVLPDLQIGDRNIVGAGAVVTKNIENGVRLKGVPARSF